jgi:hypothetical protein
VAAILTTWPLARGLTRDYPFDQGDSLLNSWILAWDIDHLLRFLGGDLAAFRGYWDANIFHPQPLALAFSEHLLALAVLVAPVYAATGNIILCYNLLFLSSFTLSALGMYLLARDLKLSAAAAFVAGVVYGFGPYRISQFAHLQVLASFWMPFVLLGVRRYLETGRRTPLAWASVAALAQNLSCGYYLLFFPPFLAAFVLHEVWRRGLLGNLRVWRELAIAGFTVSLLTIPFITPYLALRTQVFPARAIGEVVAFSADVYSYLTAHVANRMYGSFMRAYPKPEGDLFPGWVAIVLAGTGFLMLVRRVNVSQAAVPIRYPRLARAAAWLVSAVAAILVAVFLTGGLEIGTPPIVRATNVSRLVRILLVVTGLLLAVSARARSRLHHLAQSPEALFAIWAAAAWWLSLGPLPESRGQYVVGAGAYSVLYDLVPGFDGLRVPARLAMLVMLAMAVLAGFGAAHLERRRRWGGALVLTLALVAALEGTAAPIAVNLIGPSPGLRRAQPVVPLTEAPAVYRFLATLDGPVVVVHLPFGAPAHDLRYMYYSAVHWKPLLNGYSGGFPPSHYRRVGVFRHADRHADRAWQTLVDAGVTHVVVHEGAFRGRRGQSTSRALVDRGAKLEAAFGRDRVYSLPVLTR